MARTAIINIGCIVTGDLARPIAEGDALLVEGGKVIGVGRAGDLDMERADTVIDAQGSTVIPGLIDSHAHPVLGDFTPRQRTVDFIDSCLHGGVTTMISAGEVHTPGRPRDPAGMKALAILARKAFANLRPSGVKVLAGAPLLEQGMKEEDFIEMAREGVHLVGEIGLGSVKKAEEAAPMVRWAKQQGMKVTIHTGGPSIPGSTSIDAKMVLEIQPDIVGHINGGPTAMPSKDIERLVGEPGLALEIVHCGNGKAALHTLASAREANALARVIIGNDAPSGTGVVPLGILRVIALLSSFGDLPAEMAIALATGNTARLHGLRTGLIQAGYEADLVICDAPIGSVGGDALAALRTGDLPGISMILIDGEVRVGRSRNTPPAARAAAIKKGGSGAPLGGGH